MATFWKFLPFLIKLATALIGTSWGVANVALSQVGDGSDMSSAWWKVLLPLLAGVAGIVFTTTHHSAAVKDALVTPPPLMPSGTGTGLIMGTELEYLGRIASTCTMRGDTNALAKCGELSTLLVQTTNRPKAPALSP